MAQDDQISEDQFQSDLDVYRHLRGAQQGKISAEIQTLRFGSPKIGIRLALHKALLNDGLIQPKIDEIDMSDGAQEYDDILAGQKIYQETQEG